MALASVHNIDVEGKASIAHTDIAPGQFVKVKDIFKLNDFNRARFIRWSKSKNKACRFTVGKNAGKNRSPEEYKYEPESEKVGLTASWAFLFGSSLLGSHTYPLFVLG